MMHNILTKYLLTSVPHAIVTRYGTGYKDPASVKAVSAVYAEARVNAIDSSVAVGSADSATSVYWIGRVPSNAILSPLSRIDTTAITGMTSLSVGFAGVPAALVNAQTMVSATNVSGVSAVSVANLNAQAWQLAGLTSDPGGMLDIFATVNVAATAAGTINFLYLYHRK